MRKEVGGRDATLWAFSKASEREAARKQEGGGDMGAERFNKEGKGFGVAVTIAQSRWQAIDAAASATHSAHRPRNLQD